MIEVLEKEAKHLRSLRLVMLIALMLVPVVCTIVGLFYGTGYNSISENYYTHARALMIGFLSIASIFFLTYVGYDWRDKVVNILTGVGLLLIILFPCLYPDVDRVGLFNLPVQVSSKLHLTGCFITFPALFINQAFLFTLSKGEKTAQKKKRNAFYIFSAICIFPTAVIPLIVKIFTPIPAYTTMIVEAIALIPAGFAWLIKLGYFKSLNDN